VKLNISPTLQRVANHWSITDPDRDSPGNFYNSPVVKHYRNGRAFGKDLPEAKLRNEWFAVDWFLSNYGTERPIRNILSLCCGFGKVERYFVKQLDTVEACLGIDIAEGALREAARKAEDENLPIRYERADLNSYAWPIGAYDLIISNGALHHLSNLESIICGIRQALRPDGLLYCCEYVGPSLQDQSRRHVELINAATYLLPESFRDLRGIPHLGGGWKWRIASKMANLYKKRIKPGWPWWKKLAVKFAQTFLTPGANSLDFGVVHISPKEFLLSFDPSEGVRAAEILPILRKSFPDAEVKYFGGGLIQYVLGPNFYTRYDALNPAHKSYVDLLLYAEELYTKSGEIPEENAFMFARK
jgi:SAM-dependent methyltransferase